MGDAKPTPLATIIAPALPKIVKRGAAPAGLPRGQLKGAVRVLFLKGTYEVAVGEFCVIGRDDSCNVVLEDALVSRRHVRIFAMTDQVILTDLMSANGVYINGIRVDGVARLRSEDRIVVGTTELSVF